MNREKRNKKAMWKHLIALTLITVLVLQPLSMGQGVYAAEGDDVTEVQTAAENVGTEMQPVVGENVETQLRSAAKITTYDDGCGGFHVQMPTGEAGETYDLTLILSRSKTAGTYINQQKETHNVVVNNAVQSVVFTPKGYPWTELSAPISGVAAGSVVEFNNFPVRDASAFAYYDTASIQVSAVSSNGTSISAPKTDLVEQDTVTVSPVADSTGGDGSGSGSGYDDGCGNFEVTMPSNADNANSVYSLKLTITAKTAGAVSNLMTAKSFDVVVGEKTISTPFDHTSGTYAEINASISSLKPGETVLVKNILASGYWDAWATNLSEVNIQAEIITSDSGETIVLDPSEIQQIVAGETKSVTATSTGASEDGWNYFRMLGKEGSLLYLLNNYNVISQKDIVASHVIGPVIANRSAYKVDRDLVTYYNQTLTLSDLSKGISSYIGVPVARESGASYVDINYYYDQAYGNKVPDYFYMRETLPDNDALIKDGDHYKIKSKKYPGIGWVPFGSPIGDMNATHQNDNYINFDTFYDELIKESKALLVSGSVEGGSRTVIDVDAGNTAVEDTSYEMVDASDTARVLTLEAGKSYKLTNVKDVDVINIQMPEGYGFFGDELSHFPLPTVISFEEDSINQTMVEAGEFKGEKISLFPQTAINGALLHVKAGAGGEFDEQGNQIVWNLPNLTGYMAPNYNVLLEIDTNTKERINNNIAGHVVAPQAEFLNMLKDGTRAGGNMNGTAIFKDFNSGIMESHLFPYHGTYQIAADLEIEAMKTLVGGTLTAGQFEFQLEPIDGSGDVGVSPISSGRTTYGGLIVDGEFPVVVTNDADGKVVFPKLIFNEEGTYKFKVTEVNNGVSNIAYDGRTYIVTVIVGVEHGTDPYGVTYDNFYVDEVTYALEGDDTTTVTGIEFKNEVGGVINAKAVISATKKFVDADDNALTLNNDQFTFQLTSKSADPVDGLVTKGFPLEAANHDDGTVQFHELEFSKVGTYVFDVKEVIPAEEDKVPGVVYDDVSHEVTITVTEKAGNPNELEAVVSYADGKDDVVFTNQKMPVEKETSYEFTKVDESGAALAGATFGYVKDIDKETVVTWDKAIEVTSDASGKVTFADLTYDDVVGGTYYFKELTAPTGYELVSGYWEISIDTKGAITVTAKSGAPAIDAENPTITNKEIDKAHTQAVISATKKFVDGEDKALALTEGQFKFQLTNTSADPTEGLVTTGFPMEAVNDAAGHVEFSGIEFAEVGTYKFEVKEVIPAEADKVPGIVYDESVQEVIVTVTEKAGTVNELETVVSYADSKEDVVFTNQKMPVEKETSYEFTKVDESGAALAGATFAYVKDTDKETVVTWDKAIEVTSDASGKVTFADLTYDDVVGGTYYFKELTAPTGYELVSGYWEISIDTAGAITVTEKNGAPAINAENPTITNKEIDKAHTQAVITATKKFVDGEDKALALTEGQFKFQLTNTSADPTEGLVTTGFPMEAVNDAAGHVEFSGIEFAEVGTYKFQVKEVIPAEADKVPGIVYDESVQEVIVTVTEKAGTVNELEAVVSYADGKDDVVFTNKIIYTNVSFTKQNQFGTPLAGAEFIVEQVESITNHNTLVEDGYSEAVADIDTTGKFTVEKLQAGCVYRIRETKAPVVESGDYDYYLPSVENYWVIEVVEDKTMESKCIVKFYAVEDGQIGTVQDVEEDGSYTIINVGKYVFPSTGGMGSEWYTILGMLLMGIVGLTSYSGKLRKYRNEK